MDRTVTFLPRQLTLTVAEGETVLQAALRQGYRIPWGCSSGSCLVCEGRLMHGRVRLKHTNDEVSASDSAADSILCCLAYPIEDIQLEVHKVLAPGQFPTEEITAQITHIKQINADVKIVQFKLPAGKKIDFSAGQYLEIILDSEISAAFSIANAPRDDRTLELHIRASQDSASYPLLKPKLKEGELLRMRLPLGNTTLHRLENAKIIIMIAASTGISQMIAMLQALVTAGDERPVFVYWGARLVQDLYLHDEMKTLVMRHPDCRYIAIVSDQPEWPARKGLVHHAVLNDRNDFSDVAIVVGGSPGMVYATYDDFIAAGIESSQIISDVFDYAPRLKP